MAGTLARALSLRMASGAERLSAPIPGGCGRQASSGLQRDPKHRRAAREVPCALPCPLHRGGRDTAAFQSWSVAAHTHTKCPRAEGAQVTREGSPAREPGYVTHRGQEQTQEASECRARLSYADRGQESDDKQDAATSSQCLGGKGWLVSVNSGFGQNCEFQARQGYTVSPCPRDSWPGRTTDTHSRARKAHPQHATGLTPEGPGTQGHLQLHSKLEVSQPGLHEIPSENREVQKEVPLAEPGSVIKETSPHGGMCAW